MGKKRWLNCFFIINSETRKSFFFRENFSTRKNQTNNRRFNVVKVIPLKMERFDVRIGLEIRGEVECCRFITNRFEARNPIDLKHAIQRQGQINKLSYMNGRSECALAEPYWMGCGYWTLNVTWLERQFNIEFAYIICECASACLKREQSVFNISAIRWYFLSFNCIGLYPGLLKMEPFNGWEWNNWAFERDSLFKCTRIHNSHHMYTNS